MEQINFGDEVRVLRDTTVFNKHEILVIYNVERGKTFDNYYCFSEERKTGEWLSDYQFVIIKKKITSVELCIKGKFRKLKAYYKRTNALVP